VLFALERIGVEALVTDDASLIRQADRVIFPGVGEASSAMQYLRAKGLDEVIITLTQPVLGICLGMQLMCVHSEENDTQCLGIFDQKVLRFPETAGFKVPQIGWNNITDLKSPLFADVTENEYMYFVHGYYVEACENAIATTHYIQPYSSAIQKNNFFAVQFHPEKSGIAGEKILKNFVKMH
jgi:glutamine amidotransferase